MKLRLAAASVAALAALAAPAAARAATVAAFPAKPCYRSGTSLALLGSGYTASGAVNITSDGVSIGTVSTSPGGAFAASLRVGLASGERVKTYAATDQANPAITAATQLRVTALDVSIRPKSGRPGRRLRIRARGFTTGKRVYAHVVRRHYRRNVGLGRLKGACHTLRTRKRIFARGSRTGTYRVQFDTRRHYSRKAKVRVTYSVFVYRTFHPAVASAASVGERWVPVR